MKRFLSLIALVAAFTPWLHAQEWISRGMCDYTDDFINACFLNAGMQSYKVEVEESTAVQHLYRLVNPYGKVYPLNNPGDYATDPRYMIIHAEDPARVYIERFNTGMNWLGYGEVTLSCKAWEAMEGDGRDGSLDAVDPTLFGKHRDDCITFPANALLIAVPSANHGEFVDANKHGGFSLTIPFSSVVLIEADDATPVYYNLMGIPVERPTHGIYIRCAGTRTTLVSL